MRPTATLALAACLLAAADDPSGAGKGAQTPFEPKSGPGAGQKFLERFVGDWDVKKAFFPRSGEPVRAEGRCRQTMIHDGRFLRSEFVFRPAGGGAETSGLGLVGFEPETGRFTSVWTDSRQTRMSFRQGRDPFDGKSIVMESRSLEPGDNDPRRSRTVTTLDDDGRRIVHRQFALGPGGESRLMMELVMTRKAGAAAPAP